MTNDETRFRSQNVPVNTKATKTTPLVATRVGADTVHIDPAALRHLVKTMKTKLEPEDK